MRNHLVIILLLFSTLALTQTQEEKKVQTTIETMFQNVFSDLDSSKTSLYFTDDFVLFEDGEISNGNAIEQMVLNLKKQFNDQENKDFKRTNTFDFLKTTVNGNSAWIYYKNSAVFTLNGIEIAHIDWLESAYLRKENTEWKIQFLHSTVAKESK